MKKIFRDFVPLFFLWYLMVFNFIIFVLKQPLELMGQLLAESFVFALLFAGFFYYLKRSAEKYAANLQYSLPRFLISGAVFGLALCVFSFIIVVISAISIGAAPGEFMLEAIILIAFWYPIAIILFSLASGFYGWYIHKLAYRKKLVIYIVFTSILIIFALKVGYLYIWRGDNVSFCLLKPSGSAETCVAQFSLKLQKDFCSDSFDYLYDSYRCYDELIRRGGTAFLEPEICDSMKNKKRYETTTDIDVEEIISRCKYDYEIYKSGQLSWKSS